jgi:DNA-directed RNA polymerase specialized sigma24 family protein
MPQRAADNDSYLADLLGATDEATRERLLREIVTRESPTVERLLRAETARAGVPAISDAVPDLVHEAIMRLLRKLRRLIEDPEAEPIGRFRDYVGTVAFNVLRDYEQRVDPMRSRLTHRVRYVVTHTPTLALWGTDRPLCGHAAWAGGTGTVPVAPLPPVAATAIEDARQLRAIIQEVVLASGGPVEMRELVAVLAQAASLPSHPFVPTSALATRGLESDPLAALESRQYLARLWKEIGDLPPRQRLGLLLQLRLDDGESVARMLPALGIADVRSLAATLGMELEQLLAIWHELPLGDQRIASMLGLTRQQVINLRKSARDRLARHMGRPR